MIYVIQDDDHANVVILEGPSYNPAEVHAAIEADFSNRSKDYVARHPEPERPPRGWTDEYRAWRTDYPQRQTVASWLKERGCVEKEHVRL